MDKVGNVLNLEVYKDNRNIEIKNAHNGIYERYYKENFQSNQTYKSFVKKVVRMARMSDQYIRYIGYLINEQGLDSCFVLNNVDVNNAEIEMHHYPFTIYDICDIVVTKRLYKRQLVSSSLCAKEVMQLHFKHHIGLVPTSITVHELAHSGEIFIPLTAVYGNIQEFVNNYKDYINPMLLDKYNQLLEKTENNDKVDFDNKLAVKPVKWAANEDSYDGNHI